MEELLKKIEALRVLAEKIGSTIFNPKLLITYLKLNVEILISLVKLIPQPK